MSTVDMVRHAGALATLVTLLLTLAVVTLRLLALPLVCAALFLDAIADLIARPLTFTRPSPPTWRLSPPVSR